MMLVLHAEHKNYKVTIASTQISNEDLGGQAMRSRVRIPQKALREAVRIKLRLQWRHQDVGGTRNVEYLPRKTTRDKQNQAKTEPCGLQPVKQEGHRC
jgi:hypothetical protein